MGRTNTVRRKCIIPDPIAQGRQGCCCSVSTGPTSSEAEHVFPAGTHTEAHLYATYVHIYIASHTHHRHTWSTHTNVDSTNGLILLPLWLDSMEVH